VGGAEKQEIRLVFNEKMSYKGIERWDFELIDC